MGVTRRRFLSLCATGALAGTSYAIGVEPLWLRLERHEVALPRLDPAFDGYRIAQLSDFHVGGAVSISFLREAVDLALAQSPDLLVVTGDLLDRTAPAAALDDLRVVLEPLCAPDGVLGVMGNHDTGAYLPGREASPGAMRALDEAAKAAGLRLLHNDAHVVRRGRATLRIAGYDDRWCGRYRPDALRLGGSAPCTVALAHNPDCAPELAERGADLILCGHTHGGQVNLPLLGSPWLPVEHTEFVAGPYVVAGRRLYVNRGLGWTFRVRFGAPPEVTLHELHVA